MRPSGLRSLTTVTYFFGSKCTMARVATRFFQVRRARWAPQNEGYNCAVTLACRHSEPRAGIGKEHVGVYSSAVGYSEADASRVLCA